MAGEEGVNVGFKILSVGWVSNKDNLTVCVDKDDVGNSLYFKILISSAATVCCKVVLNVGPALIGDVRPELLQILVETQADDSNFVTPCGFVVG